MNHKPMMKKIKEKSFGHRYSRISLSMIVKNEEEFLAGCLESVKGIVDEIVIVDTGSSDSTVAIAESHGARVFTFPWTNDFAAARNESLGHCTGDWVLYLDADERVAPNQEAKFQALFRDRSVGGYIMFLRSEHFLPTGMVKQVNAYPRLFRRLPGSRFEGMVHEQIQPSIERARLRVLDSGIFIDHLGYGISLDKVKEKCRRNAEILRNELGRHPENAYARFMLGNTLTLLGEYELARPELELALESRRLASSLRGNLFLLLCESEMKKGLLEDAKNHCREAIKCAPRQVMGRWFLSGIMMEQHRFEEALVLLREIVDVESGDTPTQLAADMTAPAADLSIRLQVCYENLAHSAASLWNHQEVGRLSREAESLGIESLEVSKQALQAALAVKDVVSARKHIEELLQMVPADQMTLRRKLQAIAGRLGGGIAAPAQEVAVGA